MLDKGYYGIYIHGSMLYWSEHDFNRFKEDISNSVNLKLKQWLKVITEVGILSEEIMKDVQNLLKPIYWTAEYNESMQLYKDI